MLDLTHSYEVPCRNLYIIPQNRTYRMSLNALSYNWGALNNTPKLDYSTSDPPPTYRQL